MKPRSISIAAVLAAFLVSGLGPAQAGTIVFEAEEEQETLPSKASSSSKKAPAKTSMAAAQKSEQPQKDRKNARVSTAEQSPR